MNTDKQYSDFNDLAAISGLSAVTRQITQALTKPSIVAPAANDERSTPDTPTEQHNGHVPADIEKEVRLAALLKRFAQIMDIGKGTNKVYDLEQKIEYTKTQFVGEAGGKKLADAWWVAKHRKISKAEVSKDRDELTALEAQSMFDRYFLIYGTKEVWDDAERIRLPVDTIKLARPNEYEIWLKSESRRMVKPENIWFDPTRTKTPRREKDMTINTFDGLPLKPIETDYNEVAKICSPITELLHHLCEGNDAIYEWVLRWLAIPLQQPGTKLDTALIFHGEVQGAGKSLFFDRIMSRIYGDYAVTLGQGQLDSQYNDWVSNKLYALFEEIFSGSDSYSQMGMVKQLVTGNTIYISKKFMSGWQQDNFVNAIFLSNNMKPLALEQNDRRHVVCYPKQKIPEPILKEVAAALSDTDDKVIRAFYTLLMMTDLKDQTAHTPAIMTQSKREVIRLSQPNWEIFYDDWSNNNLDIPYCCCLSSDLYFVYRQWCQKSGERPTTETKVMTYIGRRESKSRLKYKTPTMISAKQAMILAIDLPHDYPSDKYQTQQDWIGAKVHQFKLSVNAVYDPKP